MRYRIQAIYSPFCDILDRVKAQFKETKDYIKLQGIRKEIYFEISSARRFTELVLIKTDRECIVVAQREGRVLDPDAPLRKGDTLHVIKMDAEYLKHYNDEYIKDLIRFIDPLVNKPN